MVIPPSPETLDDGLSVDLYALIRRARAGANEQLNVAQADCRLSRSKLRLLHILARPHQHPPRIARVGELLGGMKSGATTVLVAQLDRDRLVDRIPDEQDQRVKRVVITPKGRKLLEDQEHVGVGDTRRFIATLTPEQKRALRQALDELLQRPEIAELRPPQA